MFSRPGSPLFALSILLVAVGLVLATGAGESHRFNEHEIFVAQTATEMQDQHDFMVPHLMGEVRIQKPPMSYWLAVAAHRLFGDADDSRVTELEARLPSVASGVLLVLATYLLGALATGGRRGGLIAGAVLATGWSFFVYSRSARPEMLYALFCTLMILGFASAAQRARESRSSFGPAAAGWAAMCGALFAKGPQFPLFILIGTMLALRWEKPRLSILSTIRPQLAAFALVPPALYFAYLGLHVDGAMEHWARQVTQDTSTPLWLRPLRFYYPIALFIGIVPWAIALLAVPVALRRNHYPTARILVSCLLTSLAALSFAGKLRHHYVLPLIPMCAALIAIGVLAWLTEEGDEEGASHPLRTIAFAQFVLVGIGHVAILYLSTKDSPISGEPLLWRALPWMLPAIVLYLSAPILAKIARPGTAIAATVASLLVAWGAVASLHVSSSARWATMYDFVMEIEETVPADSVVYFDAQKRAFFTYYGSRDYVKRELEDWQASPESADPALFVLLAERVRDEDLRGEVMIEQQDQWRDDALVLFRVAPRSGARSAPRAGHGEPEP